MGSTTATTIDAYNHLQVGEEKHICISLSQIIDNNLTAAESKIWHGGPVWFINGNPIVGYSKQKSGIKLLFWSGADFNEKALTPSTGKFKDASIRYTKQDQINTEDITRWLKKSQTIQWDYKNIVKRKGKLLLMNRTENA